MFWRICYNIVVISLARIVIPLVGLFDRKMRRGIDGRKRLFEKLEEDVARLKHPSTGAQRIPRVWFHSSSMGEFEQAKPIIAELRRRYADIEIIVSFFSPSGFDHSRSYKHANIITYIPFDMPENARRFIDILKPTVAIMVRYDVWPNHIWGLRRKGVPIFIANATLGRDTTRMLPVLKQFHYALYNAIDYILTVSDSDSKMFEKFGLDHSIIKTIGDTRYDQVIQRSVEARTRHLFPENFLDDKQVLVIGSSWEEDEVQLLPAVKKLLDEHPRLFVILVPHEPNEQNLERIEKRLNGNVPAIRFSLLGGRRSERFIIVDSIGILTTLYRYAHIAYVGGSFRQGIHNVLEPAVYGIPVVLGPCHENSQEAKKLVELGAAFVAENDEELYATFRSFLDDEQWRIAAGKIASDYVTGNAGATERFLSYLEKVLESKSKHSTSQR